MHDSACPPGVRAPVQRPALEVADIVRAHGAQFRRTHTLSPQQHKALGKIERCRTAALGGHMDVCLDCGCSEPSYNSCRDRHCPKCQWLRQARWVAQRMGRVLPTHYYHVVFTLPSELRSLVQLNRRLLFNMLFYAAAQSLLELGRDPKRIGAELGITAVLHTWTRELNFHPHLHCIVTGGGLSVDGQRWVHTGGDYLLPVEVLATLFRGKFLAKLKQAHRRGQLRLVQNDDEPTDPQAFDRLLSHLYRMPWVVYAKRTFAGAEQVIKYLGRYTHRTGISNSRLVSMDDEGVTFRTKDGKAVTVEAMQFLSRFLQHVLPPRFVRIRHYGLLASSNVATKLEVAKRLLLADNAAREPAYAAHVPEPATAELGWQELLLQLTGIDVTRCASCGSSNIKREALPRWARSPP